MGVVFVSRDPQRLKLSQAHSTRRLAAALLVTILSYFAVSVYRETLTVVVGKP